MALRIFQFSVLFTIVLLFHSAQSLAGAVAPSVKEIPLALNLKNPRDVIVAIKGKPTTIRCDYTVTNATYKNDVTVAWLHKDRPVSKTDAHRKIKEDGSLFFPRVSSNKLAGEYRCNVTLNKFGSLLSNAASLQIASIDKDFKEHPQRELSVPERQPVILTCKIHSVPAALVQWERNNQPLPQSTRYVPLPSGSLLITETHSSDAGIFRCKATNTLLEKTRNSSTCELTILSLPIKGDNVDNTKPPAFLPLLDVSTNTTITSKVGEEITLICTATGWPAPTVQWFKYNDDTDVDDTNNNNVNSSEIPPVQIIGANGQIYRTNPNRNHKYRCEVRNAIGKISREFNVKVLVPPYFNITPTSWAYASSGTVRLSCQALGNPKPNMTWLKNGRPLDLGGRIKKQDRGIIFSHTFTYDYGLYQCVAENEAGKIWSAAQLDLLGSQVNSKRLPHPPENLSCRSFDETSVCLNWDAPANVTAQAYSTHSFLSNSSLLIAGPEFISNVTYQLATGLKPDTNYTFYVRLYSKGASDDSNRVVCRTVGGLKSSNRNLKVEAFLNDNNGSSVRLSWARTSTDVPCGGGGGTNIILYKISWRRAGTPITTAVQETVKNSYVINGLTPGVKYEFAVASSNYSENTQTWTTFYVPNLVSENQNNETDYSTNSSRNDIIIPIAPGYLQGTALSARTVNLTWTDSSSTNVQYYTVCYVPIAQQKPCQSGNKIKSERNTVVIANLTPDTLYEFRVRAHNFDDLYGPFSHSFEVQTPDDVPSPILNLKYKVINESAVCLYWQPPVYGSSRITKYQVSYTPNPNWPLDNWLRTFVTAPSDQSKGCWINDGDEEDDDVEINRFVSAYLLNLNVEENYTLFVRAVSENGLGKPMAPIIVSTNKIYTSNMAGTEENRDYNNFIGIAVGLALSILCVVICLTFIWYRRTALKRNRRLAAARRNNFSPNVTAHYAVASGGDSSVQVRLEDVSEMHEIQHLVSEDDATHNIPPVTPSHLLDTKGGEGFPNGHIIINGHAPPSHHHNHHLSSNGHVRITENPHYTAVDCNGHVPKQRHNHHRLEEDDNSNFQPSKFRDLQRLFENSKRNNSNNHHHYNNKKKCDPHFEDAPSSRFDSSLSNSVGSLDSLNGTQITSCFDDSVTSNNGRRISPILGPNG